MSIAFSRIQWDTSYLPLFECFVLFAALDLAAGHCSRQSLAVIAGFTILGLWTHATFAMFLACLTVAVLFVRRREILSAVAGWLKVQPGPKLAIQLTLIPIVAGVAVFIVLTKATNHDLGQVAGDAARSTWHLLTAPGDLLRYIARIGDAVTGASTYEDIAGVPLTFAIEAFSLLIVVLLIGAVVVLARAPDPADRALAVFWMIVPVSLIVTARLLTLDKVGFERYAIWLLPPVAVTLARFGSVLLTSQGRPDLSCAILILPLSAIMLFSFIPDYFVPIRQLSYRQNTYPAYWSAAIDPKFAAADWIRQHAPHTTIHAENYWIDYPLQYSLGLDWTVTEDPLPRSLPKGPIVIVCFVNAGVYPDIEQNYFDHIEKRLTAAGRRLDTHTFNAADDQPPAKGQPAVAVIIAPAK
jgi:hypothetical protein